jgi:hypothetical protein
MTVSKGNQPWAFDSESGSRGFRPGIQVRDLWQLRQWQRVRLQVCNSCIWQPVLALGVMAPAMWQWVSRPNSSPLPHRYFSCQQLPAPSLLSVLLWPLSLPTLLLLPFLSGELPPTHLLLLLFFYYQLRKGRQDYLKDSLYWNLMS